MVAIARPLLQSDLLDQFTAGRHTAQSAVFFCTLCLLSNRGLSAWLLRSTPL